MPTIVVPFRGPDAKRRLAPLPRPERTALAQAMLADVLTACAPLGRTVVVVPEDARSLALAAGAHEVVVEPGGPDAGQGAAVEAALAVVDDAPVLVVNADVPCATADDLTALLDAVPRDGLALVEARDGTTNALAFATPRLFRPLYGAGSADRFRALGDARTLPIANLMDDVDTLDDLCRLETRLGVNARRALASLELRVREVA